MPLSQELPANKQCSGGSRSLRRWKESLEDEKHSGRWSEVDKRTITEADLLTTAQEVVQELNIDHLFDGHLAFEANWKGKMLDKSVPHELTENKKKTFILKCHLLLVYTTTENHFSIGLWCAMKNRFIQQLVTTSSVAGPKRSFKALPKAKPAPKKKKKES